MSLDDPRPSAELGEAIVASGHLAPLVARGHVSRWLDGRADADVRANACLLVSELVTNSVRHADQPPGAPVRITAAASDGHVRVDVQDQGHGPVRRRVPDSDEGGFGLNLVDMIAARWGVDDERGTRVWFELATAHSPA
jgi:two-component sensor histidine kinase